MDITLHMLNGYLLASKAYLNSHLKETAEQDIRPSQNNAMGPEAPEVTREELKNALLAAQVRGKKWILKDVREGNDKTERQKQEIKKGDLFTSFFTNICYREKENCVQIVKYFRSFFPSLKHCVG